MYYGNSAVVMTGSCGRLAVLEKMTKLQVMHINTKHCIFPVQDFLTKEKLLQW